MVYNGTNISGMIYTVSRMVYCRGSQTGRHGALVRRDTLPGAPPKHVKVAYYCNENNGYFMLNIFCKLYNYIFLC